MSDPASPFVGHDARSRRMNLLGWAAAVAFSVAAVWFAPPGALGFDGPAGPLKIVLAVLFVPFALYTGHSAQHESLLRVVRVMGGWRWGRQVIADLYFSMILTIILLAGHLGPLPALAWTLPILFLGNFGAVPLIWLHLDGLWARFM